MSQKQIRWAIGVLGTLGVATVIVLHWMVFFWVPTESTMARTMPCRTMYLRRNSADESRLAYSRR